MNTMRVLYLTNASQIGGGNRSLLVLWNAIRSLGVEPVAICPEAGPMADACARAGVPAHIHRYVQPDIRTPVATLRALQSWRALLKSLEIDLVHANDPSNARSIALAARMAGVPLVCHVHFPPGEGYFDWCFRGLPKPQAFAYCSEAVWNGLATAVTHACPGSLNRVIHNAVRLADFSGLGARPLSGRPARIGIVANLLPVKGHDDFLAMAARLVDRGIDAEFHVVGGDIHGAGHGAALERLAASLHLDDRVTFTGHVSNIPAVIAELDIVVCSSTVEPFGICVIEGMAAGKPVVATEVGGIPEIVVPGQTGFLVPAHSPERLADRVEALVRDRDLRTRLGEAGRRRVEEEFSDTRQATRTLDLYREVGDRARR